MKSIGRFNYPTDGRRVMAVLIPNPEKKTYDAMVVRAIGWLGALEGGCLREELEGFGAMLDVVVKRGVD